MRKFLLIVLMLALPFATYTTLAQDEPLDCDDSQLASAEIGDSFVVSCSDDCDGGSIWGTDIYTADSNICSAAIHAGVISEDEGGEFVIYFVDGQDEYPSSEQNGITSSDWASYSISFTFDFVLEIEWDTRANELEGDTDTSYLVSCPEDGDLSSLWGTEIYTDDSSICTAAVHMGLIDEDDGGEFVVTILDGEEEYEGSEQNDIESSDWGSWSRSFTVTKSG